MSYNKTDVSIYGLSNSSREELEDFILSIGNENFTLKLEEEEITHGNKEHKGWSVSLDILKKSHKCIDAEMRNERSDKPLYSVIAAVFHNGNKINTVKVKGKAQRRKTVISSIRLTMEKVFHLISTINREVYPANSPKDKSNKILTHFLTISSVYNDLDKDSIIRIDGLDVNDTDPYKLIRELDPSQHHCIATKSYVYLYYPFNWLTHPFVVTYKTSDDSKSK